VVTITQAAGCTFGASPRSVDLAGGGGSAAVSVATAGGCSWTAAGESDWISVSPSSWAGAGSVQVTAAANNTPPRSGTAIVAGTTITVNQASLCTFVLAPRSLQYNADGGAGAVLVIVTGACSWTAASTVPWITITAGESGAGSGHVELMVASNAGAARTGSLTIAGQTVPVTQSAR
jgi:hypothetical protein